MTGPRRRTIAPLLALAVAAGVAGCHLTSKLPAEIEPGKGRVDRTFGAGLAESIRATLSALDELAVKPKGITIRANDRSTDLDKPGWASQTNDEYFPDDSSFRDLFERQRLAVLGSEPIPFAPILISYRGETEDHRPVAVVVRLVPPDALRTEVQARVGREGDEANGRKLLDQIAGHLPKSASEPTPAAPAPPADKPAADKLATDKPATPPAADAAGLPPLPPG